jgi:hypothetical protein
MRNYAFHREMRRRVLFSSGIMFVDATERKHVMSARDEENENTVISKEMMWR